MPTDPLFPCNSLTKKPRYGYPDRNGYVTLLSHDEEGGHTIGAAVGDSEMSVIIFLKVLFQP